ncbi:MAG: HPr(Ser) kinase/phosphatase [Kiritimatiellia bacterium]|nr:HPr(Ser) kinase/phosphatase [Lentisphaerota bacterium]
MSVTVKDFYDASRAKIALELVAGSGGMGRVIHEPAINRPGLALAGFFRHFAFRRIQVLGFAENDYLHCMAPERRRRALRALFERRIPCLTVCRNRRVWPEILEFSREFEVPVLRTPLITGAFINAATIMMESLMAPRCSLQGTMIDIMGIGVLMEGRPGIGKSEAALALIERGHSLVADDLTLMRRVDDRTIMGSAAGVTRYHLEIRGLGIIHVPSLFGVASVRNEKALDLIVTLCKMDEFGEGDERVAQRTRDVLGVPVPHLLVPVAPGRDLANVIEVAALNEKLKRLGHDAAKELDDKLVAVMTKGAAHDDI